MNTKQWTLTLFTKNGEEVDSTVIEATNRNEAIKDAKRIMYYQGLSGYKTKLKLKK